MRLVDVMADDWDAIHCGDKPFLVVKFEFPTPICKDEILELVRVDFDSHSAIPNRIKPEPFTTATGTPVMLLVRVTCVTPPGSYGISPEHQVVGIRRLGF